MQLKQWDTPGAGLADKVSFKDHSIPTRDNDMLQARSYRPAGVQVNKEKTLPIYVHLHGGGFLFGTLESEDATCARMVSSLSDQGTDIVVLNVNYRHTPEHGYPTAWNDVQDALFWIYEHLDEIGGDGERLVLGGISAGAMLALSTALAQVTTAANGSGNEGLARLPKIKGMVLIIPPTVHYACNAPQRQQLKDASLSSYIQNADAPVLPFKRMELFMSLLRIPPEELVERNLRLNPGNASPDEVRALPPATFGVAGRDILRDEGLLFAKMLAENGYLSLLFYEVVLSANGGRVPTSTNVFGGVPHGFRLYGDRLKVSKKWDEVMERGIKWALDGPAPGPFEIHAF